MTHCLLVNLSSLTGTVAAGTGIVGNASNQLNNPSHLCVDVSSNIYVCDTLNKRAMLWRNNSLTGVTAITSRIMGIVVDSQNNVYVAEADNHRVTK